MTRDILFVLSKEDVRAVIEAHGLGDYWAKMSPEDKDALFRKVAQALEWQWVDIALAAISLVISKEVDHENA